MEFMYSKYSSTDENSGRVSGVSIDDAMAEDGRVDDGDEETENADARAAAITESIDKNVWVYRTISIRVCFLQFCFGSKKFTAQKIVQALFVYDFRPMFLKTQNPVSNRNTLWFFHVYWQMLIGATVIIVSYSTCLEFGVPELSQKSNGFFFSPE